MLLVIGAIVVSASYAPSRLKKTAVSIEPHTINAYARGPSKLGKSERPRSHVHAPKTHRPNRACVFLVQRATNEKCERRANPPAGTRNVIACRYVRIGVSFDVIVSVVWKMAAGWVWAIVLGLAGGLLAWRLQHRRRRWRSLFDEAPAGMTTEEFERWRETRYLLRRVLISALSAAVMAAIWSPHRIVWCLAAFFRLALPYSP